MWENSRVECSNTSVNGGESFAVLSKSIHPPNFKVGILLSSTSHPNAPMHVLLLKDVLRKIVLLITAIPELQ